MKTLLCSHLFTSLHKCVLICDSHTQLVHENVSNVSCGRCLFVSVSLRCGKCVNGFFPFLLTWNHFTSAQHKISNRPTILNTSMPLFDKKGLKSYGIYCGIGQYHIFCLHTVCIMILYTHAVIVQLSSVGLQLFPALAIVPSKNYSILFFFF